MRLRRKVPDRLRHAHGARRCDRVPHLGPASALAPCHRQERTSKTMNKRTARYREHTYAIRVPKEAKAAWEPSEEALYFAADSLTVRDGVPILSVEVEPIETMEDEPSEQIELPPVAVFAPGQWYSAILVDDEHKPFFAERGAEQE